MVIATATERELQIQSEPTVCREISTPSLDTLSKDMRGVFCPSDSHHVRRHLENPLNFRPLFFRIEKMMRKYPREICGETASQNTKQIAEVEVRAMEFRIADTFTDSLARLTGDEQKAVKTTAFDLQLNSANPGMSFHKLDKARDKNFWSVRVNSDIRLIVHKSEASLLLCYVDHHDKAYDWAERRKLETHPKTGAAQYARR